MPRQRLSKPWLHQASSYWCTSIDRKRVYLEKDFRVACQKLRQLRAEQLRSAQAGPDWTAAPFADLADAFLDDIQARKKGDTHRSYRYRLLRALRILGPTIRVGELRKYHLAQIEQRLTAGNSPTTVRDTLAAVQTVFGWAVRHDLLTENPLQGYEKPRGRTRNRIITPGEFQALLRHSDVRFRQVLLCLRLTGCRPVELRTLTWSWIDLENGFWILPDHKTITRQQEPRPRIIPLPPSVWNLCRYLARRPHDPSDFVFLNRHGQPYTKDCFCRKMARVRDRAGIERKAGEQLVLYSARHTYATDAAGKVSDIELAELMGQTDTRTTRRYVHLNALRLRDIQRRAQG